MPRAGETEGEAWSRRGLESEDGRPATLGPPEAGILIARGFSVTSSLAGRVTNPLLPAGDVRIGGFGGEDGMARWLRGHRVAAVVDATHPFAEQISASARTACRQTGIPSPAARAGSVGGATR